MLRSTVKSRQHCKRRLNGSRHIVGGEPLEMRLALDGTVDVMLVGTTLTLTGDIDANDVLISQGANPNEILIEGKDRSGAVTTLINGPTLIDDPVDAIVVDLMGGSDDFRIEGNGPDDRFVVAGNVLIHNGDGNNVNRLENVVVASTLSVVKATGNSESTLEIVGTDVVGPVSVANNFGGAGPSKTIVTSGSTFQDDFTVVNDEGRDILVIDNSNVAGDMTVVNGDGDTRTVLGMSEDPIVFGDLTIVNGDGNDVVVLNDTNVWGDVAIVNGDGHSDTTVSDAGVGLGEPAAAGNNVFSMVNGIGTDTVLLTNSVVNDGVAIVNGAAETFGSTIDISQSTIRGELQIVGDNGIDRITIDPTFVGRDLVLVLGDGSSDIAFADLSIGGQLQIVTDAGRDAVVLVRTTVSGNTLIQTGDGIDRLEVLAGSKLLGQSNFVSGDGVDTLIRQVGLGELAVDIVFLLIEDFELDEFLL